MMRRLFGLCALLLAASFVIACEEPPATEPIARGRQLYRKLDCGRCHLIDREGGGIGPDLSHIGTVAATRQTDVSADDYIRASILAPGDYIVPGYNDVMPRGLARNLSPADIDALVQYLAGHK